MTLFSLFTDLELLLLSHGIFHCRSQRIFYGAGVKLFECLYAHLNVLTVSRDFEKF